MDKWVDGWMDLRMGLNGESHSEGQYPHSARLSAHTLNKIAH